MDWPLGQCESLKVEFTDPFRALPGKPGGGFWPSFSARVCGAWSVAMAGCGIKRGVVVGATNADGTFVSTEEYDIGHLFHTWFTALGIDSQKLQYDNGGQPYCRLVIQPKVEKFRKVFKEKLKAE